MGAFALAVADPPFLAPECLQKTAAAARLLAPSPAPVLLLTGAVMRAEAGVLLGALTVRWRPRHTSKLGNEFRCYATVECPLLGGWCDEDGGWDEAQEGGAVDSAPAAAAAAAASGAAAGDGPADAAHAGGGET